MIYGFSEDAQSFGGLMGFCRGWGFHGGKFQVQIWFFACEAGWSWVARWGFAVTGGEAWVDSPMKMGLGSGALLVVILELIQRETRIASVTKLLMDCNSFNLIFGSSESIATSS